MSSERQFLEEREPSEEELAPEKQQSGLGIIHMSKSVIASMFGVCSDERREKDFEEGNLFQFLAVGAVFVFIFVLVLIEIVETILSQS